MSTPSPTPLNSDLISPYAPKWAQEQVLAASVAVDDRPAQEPLPKGIETDHDAKILDDIENSLRDMIAVSHGGPPQQEQASQPPEESRVPVPSSEPGTATELRPSETVAEEPMRLSEISRLAAEQIVEEQQSPVQANHVPEIHGHETDAPGPATDFNDQQVPPWMLPRSLEPSPVPEPWPRPRSRKSNAAVPWLKRFGIAAAAAIVVAVLVVQEVPSLLYENVRMSLADLSSNAATVFNEGKAPSSLQTRLEAVTSEADAAPAAPLRVATATPPAAPVLAAAPPVVTAPAPQEQRAAISSGNPASSEPRKEAAALPAAAPPSAEPAIWHGPAGRAAATDGVARNEPAKIEQAKAEPARTEPARTTMSSEEIAMLRKLGDDYIAAGDFAGARAVLEQAANAGDAPAALALAATYDPAVLARFKVRGLQPDVKKAGFWYERARELGSMEAPKRLQTLARGD